MYSTIYIFGKAVHIIPIINWAYFDKLGQYGLTRLVQVSPAPTPMVMIIVVLIDSQEYSRLDQTLFKVLPMNNSTLKSISIGTPKTINFPFVPNGKLTVFKCPKI